MTTIHIRTDYPEDRITREAGERLRKQILKLANADGVVTIDFSGVMIASTSFFDEGIAKLSEEGWTRKDLRERLRFAGLHPMDQKVLEKVCRNRGV